MPLILYFGTKFQCGNYIFKRCKLDYDISLINFSKIWNLQKDFKMLKKLME